MKKIYRYFLFLFCLQVVVFFQGQRLGYIDSDYIFEQIPEYVQAKEKLERLAVQWEQELVFMWEDIEGLKKAYASDKIFLTATMKEERLNMIENKEKEAQTYKQKKFGVNGELISRQKELLSPIENHFFDILQKMIEQEKYSFIFDIAKQNGIFTNPNKNNKLNLSDYLLKKMGYFVNKK